jgi:uroporphyrinogen-III decarboxylase
MAEYTGKERVLAAIKGKRLDRIPISFHIPKAHSYAGYTGLECVLEPDKGLQAQIKAHEALPSDMVNVPGDPYLPTTMTATAKAKSGSDETPHAANPSCRTDACRQVRDQRARGP